jgi:hypothetical protein
MCRVQFKQASALVHILEFEHETTLMETIWYHGQDLKEIRHRDQQFLAFAIGRDQGGGQRKQPQQGGRHRPMRGRRNLCPGLNDTRGSLLQY